jgi:hypothetical protein
MKAVAVSLLVLCAFAAPYAGSVHAQLPGVTCADVRPLISWYSPSSGDNFATTDPHWGGPVGVQRRVLSQSCFFERLGLCKSLNS